MYHEFFSQKGVLVLPILAMLAFLLSFFAVVVATFRKKQASVFQSIAQLPLGDDGEVKRAPVLPAGSQRKGV
ncbi:MAG TPA: hypothetical protein PKL17_06485 [Pseudomonadota bacterium]|jgi:cbb3-type cytochrome oxidase subunit 3|nr:hypothetical protein [Pseudomonadota bacterium]HND09482.1 hypothetical protein [Pseudomonadota bacterium]HNK44409.1 hypothetical protein [Pseudomonadota bacterium]HNN50207.1 hypothetical protein [Pseudomonadota bacterium]